MKKIIYTALIATACFGVNAQTIEFNAKGSGKSTWLINNNIMDDGDEQDPAAGWGYNYGAGVTFYFTDNLGIGADLLLNKHVAEFKGIFPSSYTYVSDITLNTIDIPLMFKVQSSTGGYIELGAQYSTISSVKYTYVGSLLGSPININTANNVSDKFTSSNISALLGLGMKIKLGDRFAIISGLRFEYGLTDIKGVDAFGNNLSDTNNPLIYPGMYDAYQPTKSASASLFLGLSFTIGNVD